MENDLINLSPCNRAPRELFLSYNPIPHTGLVKLSWLVMYSYSCSSPTPHRALELLSWLVPLYFFGIQLVCFFLYFAIVYPWPYYSQLLQSYGVAVTFNSFFMVRRLLRYLNHCLSRFAIAYPWPHCSLAPGPAVV